MSVLQRNDGPYASASCSHGVASGLRTQPSASAPQLEHAMATGAMIANAGALVGTCRDMASIWCNIAFISSIQFTVFINFFFLKKNCHLSLTKPSPFVANQVAVVMDKPHMLSIVTELRERVRQDLWGRTMPFWMRYSIDQDCGGFFNCLDEVSIIYEAQTKQPCIPCFVQISAAGPRKQDGAVTDTTKHIWLQGRQCWMLARLANLYSATEIDDMATKYRHAFPGMVCLSAAPILILGSTFSLVFSASCLFLCILMPTAPGAGPRFPGAPDVAPQPTSRAAMITAAERGVDFLRRHAVQRDANGTNNNNKKTTKNIYS